jgi:hypothetical protein
LPKALGKVEASAALATAYKAAGGGAKHAPSNPEARKKQVEVRAARRAALILHDPLKDKVDRRGIWLDAQHSGAEACLACHSHKPSPRSAFDCRVCQRHGPEHQDAAFVRFPPHSRVRFGKREQREGVVVSFDAADGSHVVNCDGTAVSVYLSFGKDAVVLGARTA